MKMHGFFIRGPSSRYYVLALIFALGGLFFALTAFYAVNFPCADDFDVHLDFLNHYLKSKNLENKLQYLFTYHSQHLQILNRVVALLFYKLLGHLNYKMLIICGNLSLFGICYLFYSVFSIEKSLKPFLFLPVAFLFFQPQYAEAALWATTSWQFFYVNIFALLALIFSQKSKRAMWLWVFVFSLAAALTQGNGAIVPAVVLMILLLQKRWKASLYWGIFAVAFLITMQSKNIASLLSSGGKESPPWVTLDYVLSLLGSALGYSHHVPALVIGILIVLYFIFLTYARYYRNNPVIYGFFLFLLISVVINALFRVPLGVRSYAISRYTFLSVLVLILIYISIIEIFKNQGSYRFLFISLLILTFVFNMVSYKSNFNQYAFHRQQIEDAMLCWQFDQQNVPYPDPVRGRVILKKALKNGVLRPPGIDYSDYFAERTTLDMAIEKKQIMYNVDNFFETPEYIFVRGWAFIDDVNRREDQIFLVLESPYIRYAFRTLPRTRPDVAAHFKPLLNRENIDQSGFIAVIEKSKVIEDDYRLGIIVTNGATARLEMLPYEVSVLYPSSPVSRLLQKRKCHSGNAG